MATFYRFPCDLGGDPTTVCVVCAASMCRALGAASPEALGGVPGPALACDLCDGAEPEARKPNARDRVLHSPHPTVWFA